MWTQRHTRKEKDVKRQKEKIANCKPRSETWYRAFLHSPQKATTLLTPAFRLPALELWDNKVLPFKPPGSWDFVPESYQNCIECMAGKKKCTKLVTEVKD